MQMSLWGATVITNLLSAIPWIGTDFVQFVYTSINMWFYIGYYLILLLSLCSALPTIGQINWKALRGQKPITNKTPLLDIPYSFIAILVGIIDGDGYIAVTRTVKGYISVSLVISLDISDLPMLQMIQHTLGFGHIAGPYNNKDGTTTVKLIVNRTELQELLFPLFIYHGIFFLTNVRREQINKALYIFSHSITRFDDIPIIIPNSSLVNPLPATPSLYLQLLFFNYWVVGFTVAEGSFFIKSNKDACFQLKQRTHVDLFAAFSLLFKTTRNITHNIDGYSQFSVSSVTDIQTVINFFNQHPMPLSHKLSQYNIWVKALQTSKRYSQLNF